MSRDTLLVDDDRAFASVAAAALQREGFPVAVAHSLHPRARRSRRPHRIWSSSTAAFRTATA